MRRGTSKEGNKGTKIFFNANQLFLFWIFGNRLITRSILFK